MRVAARATHHDAPSGPVLGHGAAAQKHGQDARFGREAAKIVAHRRGERQKTHNRKLKTTCFSLRSRSRRVAQALRRCACLAVSAPMRLRTSAISRSRFAANDGVGAVGGLARLGPLEGRQALLELA